MSAKSLICLFLLVGLSACADSPKEAKSLGFFLNADGKGVDCHSSIRIQNEDWQLEQLLFFIADVEIKSKQGQWQPINLVSSEFQTDSVGLLGINCEEGNSGNWQLKLKLKDGQSESAQSIRFKLGVPFDENHKNPLAQPSPLNDSSMFWVWQTGHKFLRLEMKKLTTSDDKNKVDDHWVFHLGSTGCSAPSALRSPSTPCLNSNFESFEIPYPTDGTVNFDLLALLNKLNINGATNCQSEQDNPSCKTLFSNLFSQEQRVFR